MTTPQFNPRYELSNMPISDKTKEGIANGVLSDALQTLLRGMGMLEFNLEEAVNEVNIKLGRIESRLTSIELRLSSVEAGMEKLRDKDKTLERQIAEAKGEIDVLCIKLKDLEDRLETHKHEQI